MQLTEALAELWHARVRADLGFARDDGPMDEMIRDQAYRGSRYSFGYPGLSGAGGSRASWSACCVPSGSASSCPRSSSCILSSPPTR